MDRRQFLAAGFAAALAGCNGSPTETATASPSATPGSDTPPSATDTPAQSPPESVGLAPVATGLDRPLDLVSIPDENLQYVAQQGGEVAVVGSDGLREAPLLDVGGRLSTGYEKGLLGIAVHPEFADTRRLFVRYSAPARERTPEGYSHTFVLSEFRVDVGGYRVEPGSEREILTIPQPQPNHNAGSVLFGPDGYLYVGVGDGGGAGDQGRGHADDWYDAVAGGNGQDVTENLLGSVLRIDVDAEADGQPYAVPEENPLVGEDGLDEQYAWGFRNPWRLSFDGDDLYAGDVGQSAYEEIARVERGGNYGWNVKEGTHCFRAEECPEETPPDVRGGEPLRDPVIEYPHDGAPVSGISVVGGNVYRGDDVPGLRDRFVFGDLNARGELFVADPTEEGLWPTEPLPIAEDDADRLRQLYSVSRHGGEIYVLCRGAGTDGVYRLTG